MAAVTGLMILPFAAFVAVFALPDGAPPESCASVYPLGHTALTPSKVGEGNVNLNVTAFSGGIYVPGKTYTCMIRGGGGGRGGGCGCNVFLIFMFVSFRWYAIYFLTRAVIFSILFFSRAFIARHASVTLTSTDVFLGLLVQGRVTADGSTPAGMFATTMDVKLSSCNPADVSFSNQ